MPEAPPRVFISYSHDSDEHKRRALYLSNRLRSDGVEAIIDQYVQSPPQGWPAWCEAEIEKARFVLMICTETYLRRVRDVGESGKGLGVLWEARLIRQHLYDEGSVSGKFVPVLFADGSLENVPRPVRGASTYRVETTEGYDDLYRLLTDQPRVRRPELGKLRPMPELQNQSVLEPVSRPDPEADYVVIGDDPDELVYFGPAVTVSSTVSGGINPDLSPRGYRRLLDFSVDLARDPVAAGEHAATLGRDIFFQGPERSGKTTALNAFLLKSAGAGRSARISFLACADEELVPGGGLWQRIAQSVYEEVDDRGVEAPGEILKELQLTTYLFVKVLRIVHPLAVGFDEVGRLRNKEIEEPFYRMIREWRERDNRLPPSRLRIGLAGLARLRQFRPDDNASTVV
jgi:TIR domain